jgi:hypothetical protein
VAVCPPVVVRVDIEVRLYEESWRNLRRAFRDAAYYLDRDERRALAAFIADGGDPYEVERIEEALGVNE